MNNIYTISYDSIEQRRETLDTDEFIELSENRFSSQIKSVASEAINNNIKLIRLAGPSGSGKTTSAKRVVNAIKAKGVPAYYISMDNWYKTLKVECLPRNEDNEPDFESPDLLDIDAFKSDMHKLLNGETINLREFDFVDRVSHITDNTMQCEKDAIVVIEGLHAINPIFDVDEGNLKVYVEPFDIVKDGEIVLSSSTIRLCRRIHRDRVDRGMTLEATLKKCRSVDRGQKKYIAPYTKDTNILRIDTLIYYEVFIHRNELPDIEGLEFIPNTPINKDMIPSNSILKEFYK